MTPDTILDAESVAEHLRCSVEQAKALMASDELPATKIGRGWITTYGELIGFVSRRIRSERRARPAVTAEVKQPPQRGRRLVALPDITATR